jgi:predicted RNA-binding Zn ribbon-like protein
LTDADLRDLRDLRAAIRRLFEARIVGTAAKSADVTAANAAVTFAGMSTILVWPRNKAAHAGWQMAAANPVTQARAAIAADAIDIIAGERGQLLVECEARTCVRLMIRDHGRRQWCSTRCGDRVRASRHYARTRAIAPSVR